MRSAKRKIANVWKEHPDKVISVLIALIALIALVAYIRWKRRRHVEGWNPITELGDALGDLMIAISPTRPCQKRANEEYDTIASKATTKEKQQAATDAFGHWGDKYWEHEEWAVILQNIIEEKCYIVADKTSESAEMEIEWLSVCSVDEYNKFLSIHEEGAAEKLRTIWWTGMPAIKKLCDVHKCGKTKDLEDKWAKFGLSPTAGFSGKRVTKVVVAGGTLIFMGMGAGAAYEAAMARGVGTGAALAAGFAAGTGAEEGGEKAADAIDKVPI